MLEASSDPRSLLGWAPIRKCGGRRQNLLRRLDLDCNRGQRLIDSEPVAACAGRITFFWLPMPLIPISYQNICKIFLFTSYTLNAHNELLSEDNFSIVVHLNVLRCPSELILTAMVDNCN